ncbi:hypothetical protein [Saccharopolyspora sp. ASAGF58]|uniref:hypothetical protein n=1 Tax=Saccharopolyspora sp. ASAGF58 TaxID=2719023 RepID=UPI00144025C1|nr:hypothetical protein [Saccharopolyspora sp. ASAGF58]QIZ36986.1 hypothetical protein FDZ84_22990 [Saccharopolyspora sp. ASAGF58]
MEKIPDQPIVHLLRDNDSGALIDQLSGHLGTVVPHVRLDVGGTPAETPRQKSVQIRKLLDKGAQGLRDADSWPRIGRLRFRRYALLSWLLKKNLPPTNLAQAPHSHTRQLLREYLRSRRPRRDRQQPQQEAALWESAAQSLPWYLFALSLTFFPLYYAWWVRRGRVARWFMRQRYLSPRESADFPSFAQRLITTPSRWENAEQVRKLLVHAFLTDLAESYTRRLWRWQWVPKDCYPVLLLRNLGDETAGKILVRLINDVRNETGVPDPLLVIGSGAQPLQDSETPSAPVTLESWPETLQEARRKRSNTAWYVTLRVAGEPHSADDEPGVLLGQTSLPLKRSKLLRRIPILLVVLLVLGGGAAYLQQYQQHCGRSWWPWTNTDLWSAGDECVGIADPGYHFSSDIKDENLRNRLIDAQQAIEGENDLSEGKNRVDQDQPLPYVSVVYFSTLTGKDPDSSTLDGVAAELEGLAKAQEKARLDGGVAIRVVLANGGASMSHAPDVAERIVEYARGTSPGEPPVVAVVGLGGSWDGTAKAISTLGRSGLTMVGTVTSADDFPKLSRLYHQVGPTNLWESQVVAQHVRNIGVHDVAVYYEEGDLYSKNLAEDIGAQLEDSARLVDPQRSNPSDAVRCSPDSLVFFSGRADQFGKYLNTVQDKCVDPKMRPRLMAGDDTTKFLLDRQLPPGVELDYIDFTGLRVQEGTDGLVGRGLLAFDAVDLVRQAVRKVTDEQVEVDTTPLNGQAVWYGIARLGENPGGIRANSGAIDFGAPAGQVPVRKAISVMRVVEAGPDSAQPNERKPVLVMHCGNTPHQTGQCPP